MMDTVGRLTDIAMTEGEEIERRAARARAASAPPPPLPRTSWTVADLLATDFRAPRWIVPDLLPVGLALLAGRPKLGKSWLALQLAVAVGGGGEYIGRVMGREVTPGHALYIALEDSPRRMRSRLELLQAKPACNLRIDTAWPPLNERGLGALRDYVEGQRPALVVVDTLTRAFTGRTDWDSVGQATEALGALQSLALAGDCAILLIDHHRKGNGFDADVVDDVLGSTGKAAVADVLWGLYRKRGEHGATLRVTGRDLDENTLSLSFDRATRVWQLAEDENGVRAGSLQDAILQALDDLHGEASLTELAGYLDKDASNVAKELAELEGKGKVGRKSSKRFAPYVLR